MKRTCKLIEASFEPRDNFRVGKMPERPSAPSFVDRSPDTVDYDLATVDGVARYVSAVKDFARSVEAFEREVDDFEGEVETYADAVDDAYDNADTPELLKSFTGGDVHREIDQAGVLPGDEVVMLLRGDYDRLVRAANEECACVFDSAGKCIHRGCGLTTADWDESTPAMDWAEAAHG